MIAENTQSLRQTHAYIRTDEHTRACVRTNARKQIQTHGQKNEKAVSAAVLMTSNRKDTITQSHTYKINVAAKINDDEHHNHEADLGRPEADSG